MMASFVWFYDNLEEHQKLTDEFILNWWETKHKAKCRYFCKCHHVREKLLELAGRVPKCLAAVKFISSAHMFGYGHTGNDMPDLYYRCVAKPSEGKELCRRHQNKIEAWFKENVPPRVTH